MKKLVIAVALVAILATGTVFADHPDGWGIGLMGRGGYGWGASDGSGGSSLGGGALSLKAPSLPVYWGINLDLSYRYFGAGVTGDFYLIDDNLIEQILGWYLGLGGFVGFSTWGAGSDYSWTSVSLGVRLPIGLSLQIPISSIGLEVFLAVVPNLGIGFWFWDSKYDQHWKDNGRKNIGVVGGIGGELGFRIWF